jgi:hypothetical protein
MKFSKSGKTPQKKKYFFLLLNQVGFSRFCNTLNTMVKEFLTSGTMRRVLHFANLIFKKKESTYRNTLLCAEYY